MFPETAAQWHAALNDFPSILLLLALGFEIAGGLTRRDSLKATGFWMLVTGAVGALLAVATGLRAEDEIEHGETVHLVMERHETFAIGVTVLFVLLAAWRVWRRAGMNHRERPVFLGLLGIGALWTLWTAHIGGTIVFDFGGGVPTDVLQGALSERAAPHTHGSGVVENPAADSTAADTVQVHVDPPGTPPHQH
jgi:uncharacterized membrane protein